MKGGTITVSSPNNPKPTPLYNVSSNIYTTKIAKVLSDTTVQLESPFTVTSNQTISTHTYNQFDPSAFSLSYEADPTYVTTEHSESFALLQINGLNPDTGDISRIKVYANSKGTVGTWEQINDVALEGTEIFVDSTASLTPDKSIGIFTTQSIIDQYWEGHVYQGRTEVTPPDLTWTTESINNAMFIDSSENISKNDSVVVTQVQDQYAGYFVSQSEYRVTIDAYALRSTVSDNADPKLSIYASGSAFNFDTTNILNQQLPVTIGKKIGEIVSTGNTQRYGYTPNYTRIRSEVPTKHKSGNQISFKVEYYNIIGDRSKTISYIYDKNWQGGNRYIDGGFSMITGSLYVADSLRSGIEVNGLRGTGYIRSLGYEGFNQATGSAGQGGFLLFSGSALPQQTATSYEGVGLEMVADGDNFFRFRTNPSILDVHTKTFFLGDPTTQFISGSNGQLEISSSNFQLNPDGTINATGGTIGGTQITNDKLQSTTNLPAPDGNPSFVLSDDGTISGSNFFIRNVYDVGGIDTQFVLADTENGFFKGRNIGRQLVSDYTQYVSTSSETLQEYIVSLLPGEDKIIMSWSSKHDTSDNTSRDADILYTIATMATGSSSGNVTAFDQWNIDNTMSLFQVNVNNALSNTPRAYAKGPSGTTTSNQAEQYNIATDIQAKTVKIKVKTSITGNTTVTIKGISIVATNAFAGDFYTGGSVVPIK
jgi:hypothetical protein